MIYSLNITWMNILPISIMYMIVHDIFVSIHEITNKYDLYIRYNNITYPSTPRALSLTKQQNHPTSNPSGIFFKTLQLVRFVQETPSWQAKVPLWTSSSWSWKNMGIQGEQMDEHPLVFITIQWLNSGYQVYSWMGSLFFLERRSGY